jgi:hypothetical protein
MTPPPFEVAGIIRTHGKRFIEKESILVNVAARARAVCH